MSMRRRREGDGVSSSRRDSFSPLGAAPLAPHHAALVNAQRAAGNAAVSRILASKAVQRRTEPSEGSSQGGVLYGNAASAGGAVAKAGTPPGVAEHLLTDAQKADMPAVADAPALLQENRDLYAARAARRKAADQAAKRGDPVDPATREFTAEEQVRVDELNRRLKVRMIGDEEETLKTNGITTGAAAWFADVKSFTFLGQSVVVHQQLADRLVRAEAMLKAEASPAGGWIKSTSGLRKTGEGLHSFGLAIDLDAGDNPYLVNPDAAHATEVEDARVSRDVNDVINRAMLLVAGKTPGEADLQARPKNDDRDARALDSYDKLREASDALARYFELDKADRRAELDELVRSLSGKDKRTAEQWRVAIRKDRTTLSVRAAGKKWNSPQTGFLHLDRRLVKAMTSSAGADLTWLGDDTIGSGRDIMHFDMRRLGPIHKIVKSLAGQTQSLGSG